MNFPPLTQNQKLILSFLASTAAGAAGAGIDAIVQNYTQQGLNIPVLINIGLVAFIAFFGPALYNFVPGHIQQILQAGADTQAMYRNNAQQSQQAHAALMQTVQTLAQVAQKQAVAAAQVTPLQVSAPPVANANWMLDKPAAQQPVQQIPFPPARPAPPPQPIVFPAVKPPMDSVNMAQTPVDVSSQQTAYQSATLPPDLHFGDTGLIPQVGQ